jgi:dihydrofolate reductase
MELTATTFMTLDGVTQSPGAPDEDRSNGFDLGGWLIPYADSGMQRFMAEAFSHADAFLLGRKTYEIFLSHWPKVGDAKALNGLPKHVASTTLSGELEWDGASLLDGELAEAVTALKAQEGRELQVHGSVELTQALLAAGLLDRHRILVYPVALGRGAGLFDGPATPVAYRLTEAETTDAGVQLLTFVPEGKPRHGSFADAAEPEDGALLR